MYRVFIFLLVLFFISIAQVPTQNAVLIFDPGRQMHYDNEFYAPWRNGVIPTPSNLAKNYADRTKDGTLTSGLTSKWNTYSSSITFTGFDQIDYADVFGADTMDIIVVSWFVYDSLLLSSGSFMIVSNLDAVNNVGFEFRINTSRINFLRGNGTSFVSSSTPTLSSEYNGWFFAAGVYSKNHLTIYNGNLDSLNANPITQTQGNATGTINLDIGARNGGYRFKGDVGFVGVYFFPKDQADLSVITKIYNATKNRFPAKKKRWTGWIKWNGGWYY